MDRGRQNLQMKKVGTSPVPRHFGGCGSHFLFAQCDTCNCPHSCHKVCLCDAAHRDVCIDLNNSGMQNLYYL